MYLNKMCQNFIGLGIFIDQQSCLQAWYLHSSQNEFPQQGIITASVSKSRQRLQINSSGIVGSGAAGALAGVSAPPALSDAKYASL